MLLLDFMNNNKNWEEVLSAPPMCIKVKREGEYILLKYNQFDSDFSNPIVQEARGCIFKEIEDRYVCVCWPFNKFFNYGQEEAASIDFQSSVVYEKVDGSLMKLFYDNGWKLASNGCVYASSAVYDDSDNNFEDLFWSALLGIKEELYKNLDKKKTYMFELVSPDAKLVVSYPETAIYYLGERNTESGEEKFSYLPCYKEFGIRSPKIYHINSLKEVQEFADTLDSNAEGFVVCDKDFNRVKVKGKAYLSMFWARCNDNIGTKSIVRLIRNEEIDDVIAQNKKIKNKYEDIVRTLKKVSKKMEENYEIAVKKNLSKKEVANDYRSLFEYPNFVLAKLANPNLTPTEYLFNVITNKSLIRLIKIKMEEDGNGN